MPKGDREMNETEYAIAEAKLLHREMERLNQESRQDRQDAVKSFVENVDPETFAERTEWLIEGCYGKGARDRAQTILGYKRCNRVVHLGTLTMCMEYRIAPKDVNKAWNLLPIEKQIQINKAVQAVVDAQKVPA